MAEVGVTPEVLPRDSSFVPAVEGVRVRKRYHHKVARAAVECALALHLVPRPVRRVGNDGGGQLHPRILFEGPRAVLSSVVVAAVLSGDTLEAHVLLL